MTELVLLATDIMFNTCLPLFVFMKNHVSQAVRY